MQDPEKKRSYGLDDTREWKEAALMSFGELGISDQVSADWPQTGGAKAKVKSIAQTGV